MKAGAIEQLFRRALRASLARGDWAGRSCNFDELVDGVLCNVHCKVQLHARRDGRAARLEGECFVYVTSHAEERSAGGCGLLRFGMAERGIAQAALLYGCAFAEARAELLGKPEFLARFERDALSRDCPEPTRPTPPARRRSL